VDCEIRLSVSIFFSFNLKEDNIIVIVYCGSHDLSNRNRYYTYLLLVGQYKKTVVQFYRKKGDKELKKNKYNTRFEIYASLSTNFYLNLVGNW